MNGKIVVTVEIYVEHESIPHNNKHYVYKRGKNMEELNVNLEQAANYLIQLFYRTNQRYSCTRTKIGKLLSIIAFTYAKENKRLFNENIYKYNGCGSSINELKLFLDREIYMKDNYSDDEMPFNGDFDNNAIIPEDYDKVDEIECDVRVRIETIFRKFASFAPTVLGQCINPIVEYDGITGSSEELILSVFPTLKRNCFQGEYENKTLIDYIFGLELENTNEVGEGNA